MKLKFYSIAIATMFSWVAAMAQTVPNNGFSAGYLMDMTEFRFEDMVNLSQVSYSIGTARSSAMAGAFTSLGADLSSMSINPAGLGMYRSSDIEISPSIMLSSMENSRPRGGALTLDSKKTTFGVGNIGVAMNVYEGSRGGLTSLTFGFGYNRLTDFNYINTYSLGQDNTSIARLFANQLRGTQSGVLNFNSRDEWQPYRETDQTIWGSVLAYKSSLINPNTNADNNVLYNTSGINDGALVNHYLKDEVSGSIGEYTISAGANLGNKFYVGLTLGIQDIRYEQDIFYEESYTNNNSVATNVSFMQYTPGMSIKGTGYNAKIGVIYRPIDALRIGFAYHTPTFMDIEKSYRANMYTEAFDSEYSLQNSALLYYYPKFTTPNRVLIGASYSFWDVAIVAVDYERVWYNSMRLKDPDASDMVLNSFKNDIKDQLHGSDNVRLGVELKPLPTLAIRFGYGYYGAGLRTKKNYDEEWAPIDGVYNKPVVKSSDNYTAGLGYRFGDYYVDAAYSLLKIKYTETDLFYYNGLDNNSNETEYLLGETSSTLSKNAITFTFGYRF